MVGASACLCHENTFMVSHIAQIANGNHAPGWCSDAVHALSQKIRW